jgi:hypothetical protein
MVVLVLFYLFMLLCGLIAYWCLLLLAVANSLTLVMPVVLSCDLYMIQLIHLDQYMLVARLYDLFGCCSSHWLSLPAFAGCHLVHLWCLLVCDYLSGCLVMLLVLYQWLRCIVSEWLRYLCLQYHLVKWFWQPSVLYWSNCFSKSPMQVMMLPCIDFCQL